MNELYAKYVEYLQKIADVNYSSAILQWDQEVYMPPKGAHFRARQLATLAGYAHELITDKKYGKILEELRSKTDGLSPKECANVLESYRIYAQQKKYTTAFVTELNLCISAAFNAWQEAKRKKDYSLFSPQLQKLIDLKRKEADVLGYEAHPYDAHLNLYETGLKTSFVEKLFDGVRKKLVPYIQQLMQKQRRRMIFYFSITTKTSNGILVCTYSGN